LGLRHRVHRSTLADANESRSWRIWQEVALLLLRRAHKSAQRARSQLAPASSALPHPHSDEDPSLEQVATLYALDSTTIDLCLSLFSWAQFDALRASVKMHTLLDLRSAIPAFVHLSPGTFNDIKAWILIQFESCAFYVMDRGYIDFAALHCIHLSQAFFVVRAKSNLLFQRRYSHAVDKNIGAGVRSDRYDERASYLD
jgi:hypothetical protein